MNPADPLRDFEAGLRNGNRSDALDLLFRLAETGDEVTTQRLRNFAREVETQLADPIPPKWLDHEVALHVEVLGNILRAAREDGVEAEAARPFAQSLDQFIADKLDAPEPLLGTEDDCILPAQGLALLIAKGGKGKTTLSIELALHLASGMDYLGLEVGRPLTVLFIENEGPREPFRRKLERKRKAWPHEIAGAIFVHDENWGHARLDFERFVERLNTFCDEHEVDVVFGDPLDSLGMAGEGSPSETRAMVDRFKRAGLFSERAWILPHHARKDSVDDAVDEASGAWAGRPDAMLALEKRGSGQARLSFPKVRWQGRERSPYLLDFDSETETFTFVKEEEGEERDYVAEIEEWLSPNPDMTAQEIADAIKASKEKVKPELMAHPDRFESRTGAAAKLVGRHPNATVWRLASGEKPDPPDALFQGVSS
jgi:AAA domain